MSKIEEVKKILEGHMKPQSDYCVEDYAREV